MFFHKKPASEPAQHQEGLQTIITDLRKSVAWTDLVFANIALLK